MEQLLRVSLKAIAFFLIFVKNEAWAPRSTSVLINKNGGQILSSGGRQQTPSFHGGSSSSRLFNIPPPAETDTVAFKEYSSSQSPPASFFELQRDCIRSARLAMQDNHKLLEIEFPPLPANVLEMDDVSAYDVAEANLNLALEFSKGLLKSFAARSGGDDDEETSSSKTTKKSKSISKVAILFPDDAELEFSVEKAGGTADPFPGIVLSSLRQSDPNDFRLIKPEQLLLGLFGRGSGGIIKPIEGADVYIILTASAQELPDVEELYNILQERKEDATIIFYNLKLDTLRGDLGAPAFPSRDFQDRFLSRVKPVYYLRTRQYSRSTNQTPFLVNFQGCLFRAYPGQYQTLLDTGMGKYRRLKGNTIRPGLGEFKQQLIDALVDQGVLPEEGETLSFLRTGYKTTTWWEEERPQASMEWRT